MGGVWWYRREVAVEGWRPVEDLVRWGFAHAPVVMANEAHSGLARCVRTREVGVRMIRAAHEAGVRRLAMEALPHRPGGPLGWHFRDISGVDPFVIDQDVTVDFGREPQPWVRDLLASLSDILAAHGGTAGILRDQAPPPLDDWAGVDALVVSTDNEMTEDPVTEDRA